MNVSDQVQDQSAEEVVNDQSEADVNEQSEQGEDSETVNQDLGRLSDELDGDYSVDQVKELVDKGQQYGELQREFTKKSQELSDLRNKVEKMEEVQTMSQEEREDQRIIEEVAKRSSQMNQEQIEDVKTELEIQRLRNRYPDVDDEMEEKVLRHAAENKIPNLEEAYKAVSYDRLAKRQRDQKKNRQESEKNVKGTAGANTAPTKDSGDWVPKFDVEKDKGKSTRELVQEAKQALEANENA